jgi:kumamolisin
MSRQQDDKGALGNIMPRLRLRYLVASVAAITSLFAGFLATGASAGRSLAFSSNFTSYASNQLGTDGYSPAQIETAYNIAPLLSQGIDGTGQTIGVIEFDKYSSSDLHQFDLANNIPDPSVKSNYQGGKKFTLTSSPETTMDLEWAHALAPGAKISIYYLKNSTVNAKAWKALGTAINKEVTLGAKTVSLSFGTCGPTNGYTATRTALAHAQSSGVSVFVSSGDDGALAGPVRDCGRQPAVGYPASDPSVVAVGGTSLLLDGSNAIQQEVTWRLTGGGDAYPLPRPSWQVASTLPAGKDRFAPDVSFLGDPSTGAAIFYKGSWGVIGGTSLGAPSWAAVWALVNQSLSNAGKRAASAAPTIYQVGNSAGYAQAFNDIISGSNGYYRAGTGWDAVTGWGSPNVGGLATAVSTLAG